MAASLIIFLY